MKIGLPLLFLALLFSQKITAQRDKGAVRLGYAIGSFQIESVSTGAIYAEFSKTFTGPMLIAFGGSYSKTSKTDGTSNTKDLQTFSLRLNAYFNAFENDWQQLYIGAGVSGRQFSEDWVLDENRALPESAFKPGGLIILNYDFFINDNWMIGAQASGEFFGNENTIFLLGAHLGFRFD
ncbi:MAG: hypothetical protein AAF990_17900 [Bacteroidota bacterium]